MKPVEPKESPFGDGRLAEATVMADGSWIAWNAEGKRIQFVDVDDFEVIDWLLKSRPWEEETRMTNQSDPLLDEAENIADAATALVGVVDEGIRGLVAAFGGIETVKGRDGDPGPRGAPGPPGESIKGDPGVPGQDGTDAPRPIRVVAERNYQRRLTGAQQVLSNGSTRHFDARRDVHGLIAEFVLSPGQEPQP